MYRCINLSYVINTTFSGLVFWPTFQVLLLSFLCKLFWANNLSTSPTRVCKVSVSASKGPTCKVSSSQIFLLCVILFLGLEQSNIMWGSILIQHRANFSKSTQNPSTHKWEANLQTPTNQTLHFLLKRALC